MAAEFLIAAANPSYGSFAERWGNSLADALVSLGVMGEILVGSMGSKQQGELARRATNRLAKAEESLRGARFKLLLAEAKLEPRSLTPQNKKTIANIVGTSIAKNVNFVVEQSEKAGMFAASIMAALKDCGVPIGPLQYEMPPGERLKWPTVLHCPGGTTSADDPLYKALNACGIHVGLTSLTTLSLEMPTPTPLDIGQVFPMLPTGRSLPNDEYILWVGEQSAFDDQAELVRRVEGTFGPISTEE